jgi:hypothetical protein
VEKGGRLSAASNLIPSLTLGLPATAGGSYRRAAFWRELGFPNLERARAAKAKNREQRLKLQRIEAAKRFSPFAMMDDLSSYDGLSLETPAKARWSKKLRQR